MIYFGISWVKLINLHRGRNHNLRAARVNARTRAASRGQGPGAEPEWSQPGVESAKASDMWSLGIKRHSGNMAYLVTGTCQMWPSLRVCSSRGNCGTWSSASTRSWRSGWSGGRRTWWWAPRGGWGQRTLGCPVSSNLRQPGGGPPAENINIRTLGQQKDCFNVSEEQCHCMI